MPTKSLNFLKEQTKTCPGQAKFESYLSQGQAGIHIFSHTCKTIILRNSAENRPIKSDNNPRD